MSAIKVKDLMKVLEQADPESVVIMQGDPEGNFHSTIWGAYVGDKEIRFNGIDYEDKPDPFDNDTTVIIPHRKYMPIYKGDSNE